ncbi:homocysteine S-methyltransferase [uncultured Streptococcus sp.]|uniref:homocysteine S-methyltransferase n=1 Tax=uncultured Streptococcus sp. TaxID=83427 RepID=UPI0027DB9B89|nr:homocysteine S-methyltransferase [uncultured Streptococcus sp.]
MSAFKDLLSTNDMIILDGALGTELEKRGYDVSGKLWSAKYLIENPQVIQDLHETYLRAGADILTTSSYQATVQGLKDYGLTEAQTLDLIALTVTLAAQARDKVWADLSEAEKAHRPYPLISGDVGPYAAYLADGSEYTGAYELSQEAYKDFHRPRIQALLDAGADMLGIETIPNVNEVKALLDLLADEFPSVEAYISFTAQDDQHISDGTPIEEVAQLCDSSQQILALGINCSAPALFDGLIARIKSVTEKALVTYPNSGEVYDGATQTWKSAPDNSHTLLENALRWHKEGAQIVGGCCRTSPDDIAFIAQAIR